MRHSSNPQVFGIGDSAKVRHGPLGPGAEAVDLAETLRLRLGPSSGQPQRLGVIAEGRAALHPSDRTVGLPGAVVAGRLVKVDDLAAMLADLRPLCSAGSSAGIRVGRVLERIGRHLLVRLDDHQRASIGFLKHALLTKQPHQKLMAGHGGDLFMILEPLHQHKAVVADLLERPGRLARLDGKLAVVFFSWRMASSSRAWRTKESVEKMR